MAVNPFSRHRRRHPGRPLPHRLRLRRLTEGQIARLCPERRPLSGDKVGRDAVLAYMLAVSTLTGGRGGFKVRSLAADRDVGMALVRATAWSGDEAFVRDVVHVARISDRQIIEF